MPPRREQVTAAAEAGWGAGDGVLCNLASARSLWPAPWRGSPLHYIRITGSTNDDAWLLAESGAPEGTAVVAGEQSGGRGRRGREWFSPAGGLWMSVILRPAGEPPGGAELTVVCALAAARAVEDCAGLRCGLKWPNDVLLGGKKAGGILVEARRAGRLIAAAVAGLGLNANVPASSFPGELRGTATSLSEQMGREVALAGLAGAFVLRLEEYLHRLGSGGDAGRRGWLDEEYRARDALSGKKVRVRQGTRVLDGLCRGVDARGFLVVSPARGEPQAIAWCDSLTVLEGVGP